MILTEKEKKTYLKNFGKCPFCKSDNISGESVEIDGKTAWQRVSCDDCYAVWNDIYTLSDIEVSDGGDCYEECVKVTKAPADQLPLMLHELQFSQSKTLLEKRLKRKSCHPKSK